jgi:hypothetical protein
MFGNRGMRSNGIIFGNLLLVIMLHGREPLIACEMRGRTPSLSRPRLPWHRRVDNVPNSVYHSLQRSSNLRLLRPKVAII